MENFIDEKELDDIEKELNRKNKLNRYIIIIPIISVCICCLVIFISIYFSIKNIKHNCEKGEGDKCLSCNNKICASCNPKLN